MENVASIITLPTLQNIKLRQKSSVSLSFTTISDGATSATVSIDTTGVIVGTYKLVLESYDSSAGPLFETLKTDTVTIYVTEYVRSA